MAKRSTEEVGVNMTPMIDIVFQLIIFFVVTVDLDRQVFNESIKLAFSPNGPPITKRDPRTVTIDVDDNGKISISRQPFDVARLTSILSQARIQGGAAGQSIPVLIRGDRTVRHEAVRSVMQAAGKAGLYRISFVATKEEAARPK
jgi:biopolymer transport protein ExbD